jgi:hypothetical protein
MTPAKGLPANEADPPIISLMDQSPTDVITKFFVDNVPADDASPSKKAAKDAQLKVATEAGKNPVEEEQAWMDSMLSSMDKIQKQLFECGAPTETY